jgi:hypothetical protein
MGCVTGRLTLKISTRGIAMKTIMTAAAALLAIGASARAETYNIEGVTIHVGNGCRSSSCVSVNAPGYGYYHGERPARLHKAHKDTARVAAVARKDSATTPAAAAPAVEAAPATEAAATPPAAQADAPSGAVPRPSIVPKTSEPAADAEPAAPRHRRYAHYRHHRYGYYRTAYWEPFPIMWPHFYHNRVHWNRIPWFVRF